MNGLGVALNGPSGGPARVLTDATAGVLSRDFARFERELVIDGGRVRVMRTGSPSDPAIVYIHGIMGRWQHWTANIVPFQRDHQVIALDLPGFGESDMPARPLTMELNVDTVVAVCERLAVSRATLVGNSMGGMVAAMTAKREPGLVERLVVADGAGFSTALGYLRKLRPLIASLDRPFKLAHRNRAAICRRPATRTLALTGFFAHPSRVDEAVARDLLDGLGRPGFKAILPHVIGDRLDRFPGRIACPTLIVWGHDDVVIPRVDAPRYAKLAPDSRMEIIARCGHLPMIEAPRRFNELLAGFLADRRDTGAPPPAP